jgi:hypothetical protein
VAYSYGRTLLGQVAGGVTAFVGIWAVISPFLLNYPQNSTLFLVSVLLGAVTAALAGYAITLGDTLRMQGGISVGLSYGDDREHAVHCLDRVDYALVSEEDSCQRCWGCTRKEVSPPAGRLVPHP